MRGLWTIQAANQPPVNKDPLLCFNYHCYKSDHYWFICQRLTLLASGTCISMCVLRRSLCTWSVPRRSLLRCGSLLWSSRCWCPWLEAASRSSPGWSGCSRSACHSGPCRSPSRPARGGGSRRGKGVGWSGWSSVPGGWCRRATRSGPGLTKIPSDEEKEREVELWVICYITREKFLDSEWWAMMEEIHSSQRVNQQLHLQTGGHFHLKHLKTPSEHESNTSLPHG